MDRGTCEITAHRAPDLQSAFPVSKDHENDQDDDALRFSLVVTEIVVIPTTWNGLLHIGTMLEEPVKAEFKSCEVAYALCAPQIFYSDLPGFPVLHLYHSKGLPMRLDNQ